MERDDLIDLGTASVETQGAPGAGVDDIGKRPLAGLTDD